MGLAIKFEKYQDANAIKTSTLCREDWLTLRQSGIGGSDIAAIIGVSPYATAYDIYQSKTQPLADEDMNEFAYWGTILEDTVAREFSKRSGLKIQNVNFLMRHPEHRWAIANIDRAVVNNEVKGWGNVRFKDGKLTTDQIVEIKTASEYVGKNWGNEESDEVPDQYQCQAQWYMGVTDTQVCHMAVLIGGNKYRQYKIERHQDFIDYLFEAAESFWTHNVLAGVEPDATTLQNAKDKYPRHNPDTTLDVEPDSEAAKAFEHYESLKAQEKEVKAALELAQTDLICQIQDNETLAIDGEVVATYKVQVSNRFDSSRLKKDMPELAEKYIKQSESRVMRVK
ncbi:probable phage-related protein [Psychrobacter arcticus 273-4]|uniref:Probable phage-related protein n=1 Tax=Psychrobacter arcticus (strain DSM 17307 / VKM B-2377 / 273-4) TaxID=259536 RepID=Q4FT23_PSYA2|nr:YqaJ viral recombinase family protein [Psychrobacter arcticus]AAZ18835.1 probable phage-related protein [Psychrobacter arcticus 273-4]